MRFPCTFYLSLVFSFHGCIAKVSFPKYDSIHDVEGPNNSYWESYPATFDQLIDHNDPALGTFSQRYWWSTQFYGPPGSPVILFTPGEEPALDDYGRSYYLGYTADNTLTGQYAKAVGGAGIVLEHRYWGNSTPVSNLTVDNLRFLIIGQAIQDMVYFANNVKLPFDHNGSANADKCPWVLVGGSYSGALTAWTAVTSPGTFWAHHASSAPVQANQNLWTYFKPIQEGMPANCSKDMQLIIEFVDKILFNGTQAEVLALKTLFSLQNVEHNADFASLLIQGLWLFQSGFPSFYPFCDAIEGVNANSTLIPDENGVGLEAAILNFGAWMQPSGCGNISDCYDTYNGFGYYNPTYNPNALAGRAWWWLQCNEPLGYWQTGAPIGQTTLVSRLITSYYWQRQCLEYFPGANFSTNEDPFNAKYAGWDIANTTRLMFSNGEFDPWRSASVSSEFRPGGPLISTPEMPIIQVPRGIHCQDLYMENVTPEILETMGKEVQQMKFWVDQYYTPGLMSSSAVSAALSSITGNPSSITFQAPGSVIIPTTSENNTITGKIPVSYNGSSPAAATQTVVITSVPVSTTTASGAAGEGTAIPSTVQTAYGMKRELRFGMLSFCVGVVAMLLF